MKCENNFVEGAKEVNLEESGWTWEESLSQLKEDMGAITDLLRVEETKKMVLVIEVSFFSFEDYFFRVFVDIFDFFDFFRGILRNKLVKLWKSL